MAYEVAVKTAPMSSVASLKVVNAVGNVFGYASQWNQRRKTVNELNNLSDMELNDIGISRGDIKRIAAGGQR